MVRATFAGFSTALSALQANQKRLDITGQNLSNMNTPGYTRQELKTSSFDYTNPISHYTNGSEIAVGFGVKMDTVTQIRDPYLDAQYRNQMSKASYTDSIQTSLNRLSEFLDESHISGIRQAFDNIQSTLRWMQDTAKVDDTIYESELRSRMQALTNLLNDGAQQILDAEKAEFTKLSGYGTSEQGDVERVNDILEQIGQLNRQIKQDQIYNSPSLELMDQRNLLLDELASYIPIEVSYYNDYVYDSRHSSGLDDPDGTYVYGSNNQPIGKKDWPDDLRVEMVYNTIDENGTPQQQRITLVEGTIGTEKNNKDALGHQLYDNVGHLEIVKLDENGDPILDNNGNYERPDIDDFDDPTAASKIALIFTGPQKMTQPSVTLSKDGNQFPSNTSSIQGSLDMLWKDGSGDPVNNVKGYQFYMDQLDTLAQAFAGVMNTLNTLYYTNVDDKLANTLIVNKKANPADSTDFYDPDAVFNKITAANIGISANWSNGAAHISTNGQNPTDTIMNMLEAMEKGTFPYTKLVDSNGNILFDGNGSSPDLIGDKTNDAVGNMGKNTFADFINHTSAVLANDSYHNSEALKTNVTVLNGIQNTRDSISGVSLDEEAANMMMYMSAYNAASRLMTTLDEALNTLINGTGLVGR